MSATRDLDDDGPRRTTERFKRRMLSAEKETRHANDVGFGAGRPGAVGDACHCAAANGGCAIDMARRYERVFYASAHEAVLFYVRSDDHRPTGGVRATVASARCSSLPPILLHHQSGPPEFRPSNPEIFSDGARTAGEYAPAGFLEIPQAEKLAAVLFQQAVIGTSAVGVARSIHLSRPWRLSLMALPTCAWRARRCTCGPELRPPRECRAPAGDSEPALKHPVQRAGRYSRSRAMPTPRSGRDAHARVP